MRQRLPFSRREAKRPQSEGLKGFENLSAPCLHFYGGILYPKLFWHVKDLGIHVFVYFNFFDSR
jgi:hypothetical protein